MFKGVIMSTEVDTKWVGLSVDMVALLLFVLYFGGSMHALITTALHHDILLKKSI